MNYRHAYHAGNFADVLKHLVLVLVLEHMKRKDAPFRVIDTHAGTGCYELTGEEARKTGEWRDGIGRLLGPDAAPLAEPAASILRTYLDAIAAHNPGNLLSRYPGSPLIASDLLRREDRLQACELHPEDCRALAARFANDARIKITAMNGWLALKSFLPPRERRGVVLIDPPYEERDEFANVIAGLQEGLARFATGTFIVWYPIKDAAILAPFHDEIAQINVSNLLEIRLYRRAPHNPTALNGCGLLVLNPPWTLEASLKQVMPALTQRLAVGAGAFHVLGWPTRKRDRR